MNSAFRVIWSLLKSLHASTHVQIFNLLRHSLTFYIRGKNLMASVVFDVQILLQWMILSSVRDGIFSSLNLAGCVEGIV